VTALVLALALVVAVAGLVVGLLALAAVRRARQQVRTARLALAAAEQHAADESARKESALRLLEEQRVLRRHEFDDFTQKVHAMQWAYDDALRRYRHELRLTDPAPKRLH